MRSNKHPDWQKQTGASAIMILLFLGMAAVCLMVGFKLYPAFYENWQVETIVESFEEERGLEDVSVRDIERRFQNRLITNNVRTFDLEENASIVIEDEQLGIYLDYEVRVNIYNNIDAIVSFKKTLERRL